MWRIFPLSIETCSIEGSTVANVSFREVKSERKFWTAFRQTHGLASCKCRARAIISNLDKISFDDKDCASLSTTCASDSSETSWRTSSSTVGVHDKCDDCGSLSTRCGNDTSETSGRSSSSNNIVSL
eukprot:gnl/TRDRNA2_/TRDRNA2_117961_c0_seq1.p1 gnl/TRDRNA2_/TRDRNA2_117961_c0~~gnl/TRDRNA2_/TRDRNA2_117961_c0_seq1.p1  ORF type:complete len:127 (+),score=7.46 gnl/TRDRNA2_/TRDRNA2_117961_c0_seq1:29-409(+)